MVRLTLQKTFQKKCWFIESQNQLLTVFSNTGLNQFFRFFNNTGLNWISLILAGGIEVVLLQSQLEVVGEGTAVIVAQNFANHFKFFLVHLVLIGHNININNSTSISGPVQGNVNRWRSANLGNFCRHPPPLHYDTVPWWPNTSQIRQNVQGLILQSWPRCVKLSAQLLRSLKWCKSWG